MIITRALQNLGDTTGRIFLITLLAFAIFVPLSNLLLPPSSAFYVPIHIVSLLGKYLCYAILAVAVDLVWGFCGILTLGHAAFFALGGYAMGMYLMRQIGTRGVYADPILPDFMVFLNWKELPWYWYGFDFFPFALLMVFLVPGLLAFIFGWLAFRSRVTGVYLSIITQAMTYALLLAFFRNDMGFGGNNGLTDFKDILGFDVQAQGTQLALFVISITALALAYIVCRLIVTSTYGKVLIAIRDAESRTRFLGYRVENYKLLVFVISACIAGLAGALYVPQVGIINPSEFTPANSIEAVIWVAVGGRGTLTGAALGAVLVNYAKTVFTSGTSFSFLALGLMMLLPLAIVLWRQPKAAIGVIAGVALAALGWPLSSVLTEYWPFLLGGLLLVGAMASSWHSWALGAVFGALLFGFFIDPYHEVGLAPYWLFLLGSLFVVVTLFLPKGIVGTIGQLFENWRLRQKPRDRSETDNGLAHQPAE